MVRVLFSNLILQFPNYCASHEKCKTCTLVSFLINPFGLQVGFVIDERLRSKTTKNKVSKVFRFVTYPLSFCGSLVLNFEFWQYQNLFSLLFTFRSLETDMNPARFIMGFHWFMLGPQLYCLDIHHTCFLCGTTLTMHDCMHWSSKNQCYLRRLIMWKLQKLIYSGELACSVI